MLRLLLLRHAKSSWENPALPDIARPLSARGRRAAPLIGSYIETQRLFPDRILCSTAQRTRETLAALLPHLRKPSETRLTEQLYRESEGSYLQLIRELGDDAETLLVIGHNPAVQETAVDLPASGAAAPRAAIARKYPTGGLAVITFRKHDWADVTPGSGKLITFVRPRDLGESR